MTTLAIAYIFIGCGVWAVVTASMIVYRWGEEITEAEAYELENEQWQRDQDEQERVNQ